ncbi:hypothetical protein DM02DRAFT_516244 [Periconia macrospinosa]|uniref:DUF7357 domain-containing protein n=1 Tax=Periconia macrospinosa TaxID=97972 RepID=A0A2V1E6E7_9PLEO|nr:hypothetical protein DM02DRAFT_516244 [Periconia macrospinosa]
MRLRLSVQRNNLPASNILWNVPDTNSAQAYTISRLLEDVNQVLPLEAEQWGLEDYTVEVGGFECLHFSSVFQTLKDDDLVSIRPLLTAEVRSRTLCGRLQISGDGRHLLDGVPFGRPLLKKPRRPAIHIPPRKRRRVEDDTDSGANENGDGTAGETTLLQITDGKHEDQLELRKSKVAKKVHFTEPNPLGLDNSGDDDEDEDEDEKFTPSSEEDSIDTSSSEEDFIDTSSSAESVVSADSSDASDSSSSEEDSSSDSSSDIDSSSSDSGEERKRSKMFIKPPGEGSKHTKRRNARRHASAHLRKLKQAGKLKEDASFDHLRAYIKLNGEEPEWDSHPPPSRAMASAKGKIKRLDDEDKDKDKAADVDHSELEKRKQEMLAKFDESSQTEASRTENEDTNTTAEISVARPETPPDIISSKPDPAEAQPTRRLRPDVAAIGRILARQTKNPEKITSKESQIPAVEPEGAEDPDFWKSRVKLSAFECWEEDHELSAPPFPFKQHWDPASQLMREKATKNRKKGKKRKRSPVRESLPSPEEEEEEEEEALVLNYDDSTDTTSKQDSDHTAAIESQLLRDVEVAAKSDLPPLPEDVASLPALQTTDIQVGAVIAFKLWNIDPDTCTPEITDYKTAIVEKEGDSGKGAGQFRLKLAARDVARKKREIMKRGNRVEVVEDASVLEDASVWEGMFNELLEPKLVQAAT